MWDDIEGTHACYNSAMEHVLESMTSEDMLLVASHNQETCDLAMNLSEELCLKDRVLFGQLQGFSD